MQPSTAPHPSHTTTQALWVRKTELSQAQLQTLPSAPLTEGQARLRVDSFALTANNMTYAAFGDAMHYWDFFPTGQDGWGMVPVWGFGTVVETQCEALALGETFWGYYPMASSVVVQPDKCTPRGFKDGAAHRSALPSVYNQYLRPDLDAFQQGSSPALQALLRPLFVTAWLIDDFLADQQFFGARTALLSSASSKTAYSTAFQLKQRDGIEVLGLTSAANLAYCESLGCYHRVLTYEQLDQIDASTECVYVDFAGNAALRLAIHTRFQALTYSCSIGGTHLSALGSGKGLPGPRPILFFAPAQSQKRIAEWGAPAFEARMIAAWRQFIHAIGVATPPWLVVQHQHGPDEVMAAYQTMVSGKTSARLGIMLSF